MRFAKMLEFPFPHSGLQFKVASSNSNTTRLHHNLPSPSAQNTAIHELDMRPNHNKNDTKTIYTK
jgi:hypothetical protein